MGMVVEPTVCDPQSDESLDSLIDLASRSAEWVERDAKYLVDKVDGLLEAGTWPRRLEGEPKTWERFCTEVLGYDAGYIEAIREGVAILEGKGIERPTVGEAIQARELITDPVERGKMGGRGHKSSDPGQSFRGGNDPRYLVSKLKDDRPDIYARWQSGEFPSVKAAAREAGIVKKTITIPADPHKAAAALRRHFDDAQWEQFLEEIEAL